MGLRVNNNIAASNAYRNLNATDNAMSKSLEKLSSGLRINRAADDAAGLAISEGLRSQIGGLKVAVRNTQDGVSVVQTAGELLQRLAHRAIGHVQVPVGVERGDVVVDAQTHGVPPWNRVGPENRCIRAAALQRWFRPRSG